MIKKQNIDIQKKDWIIKVINNKIDTYKRREQIIYVYFYLIEGDKFKDIKINIIYFEKLNYYK